MKDKNTYSENAILKHDNSFNIQFGKTGERPQNFIKNVDPACRYLKYPRMSQLMQEKNSWIKKRNHPPVYLNMDLQNYDLSSLGKFDVIYCDPPWEEYEKRAKRQGIYADNSKYYKSLSLEDMKKIKVGELGDNPSFLFLWSGSEHLEDGRQLLKEWGFKRCEDIVWVKTNLNGKKVVGQSEEGIFHRVKEHCLMGYKGDTKKAFDHSFIHPNIDIDVVITEEPESGSLTKPNEVYDIIQRFCLGRKRVQLFAINTNIRNGWLTLGNQISQNKFQQDQYNQWFQHKDLIPNHFLGGRLSGTTPGIQSLRPKQDTPQQSISQTQLHSQNSIQQSGKKSAAKSDCSKY